MIKENFFDKKYLMLCKESDGVSHSATGHVTRVAKENCAVIPNTIEFAEMIKLKKCT